MFFHVQNSLLVHQRLRGGNLHNLLWRLFQFFMICDFCNVRNVLLTEVESPSCHDTTTIKPHAYVCILTRACLDDFLTSFHNLCDRQGLMPCSVVTVEKECVFGQRVVVFQTMVKIRVRIVAFAAFVVDVHSFVRRNTLWNNFCTAIIDVDVKMMMLLQHLRHPADVLLKMTAYYVHFQLLIKN